MSKKKKEKNEYLGKYLKTLENLPVNKDTLSIADVITSIDKYTYRKDWLKVYKKNKKLIEYLEEKTEINNEENHYFLYLSPLLESLYINAYSALAKIYNEAPKVNEEELDSMEEFVTTAREKYGEMLEEMIAPTPRTSAYNRLMSMTREAGNQNDLEKYKVVMEKLEDIRLKLNMALLSIYSVEEPYRHPYSGIDSFLIDAEASIIEIKLML